MTLSFDSQFLTITLRPMEKLWAVRGDLKIPAAHVTGAWAGMPKTSWRELRVPGSFVPGLIKAGRYLTPRGKEFWYVTRRKRHPITIELTGEKFDRLVLGFEDLVALNGLGLKLGSPPETITDVIST